MKEKGFTLIESLVAVVVFLIALTALMGVFASALRNQRYILASQQLLDQSSYALEYMSKSLRMAKEDEGGNCIGSGDTYEGFNGESLEFKNQRKECQTFSLTSGELLDRRYSLEEGDVYDDGILPLLSDSFEVSRFGVSISDSGQPRVTVLLDIVGKEMKDKPRIRLQTTVSQRDLILGD